MMKNSKNKKIYLIITGALVVILSIIIIITSYLSQLNEIIYNDKNLKNNIEYTKLDFEEILSQTGEIKEVSTKYSVLYKNINARKMYVFSTPVRELSEEDFFTFDKKIYLSSEYFYTQNKLFNIIFKRTGVSLNYADIDSFSFLFEGFETFQKESEYINIYGEKRESVKYEKDSGDYIIFTPTYNGMHMEYNIQNSLEQISFELNDMYEYLNNDAGYASLLKDKVKKYLISQAIIIDNQGNYHLDNEANIVQQNGTKFLVYNIPENLQYPIKLTFSSDFYSEKMFFDTSVYKNIPKTNTIFNNVTILSSTESPNYGYTYMKFNIRSFTPKNAELLERVLLNIYAIDVSESISVGIYKVKKDWCSWTLNWNTKPNFNEQIGVFDITEAGWQSIDLTDYVVDLINNDYDRMIDNSIVLRVMTKGQNRAILASADNTYAPPYFEINYRVG